MCVCLCVKDTGCGELVLTLMCVTFCASGSEFKDDDGELFIVFPVTQFMCMLFCLSE